jgi:hypothetical protein
MNPLIAVYKNKNRPPFFQIWKSWYISSILDVICGLISILTFCFWRPRWNIKWNMYIVQKFAKTVAEKMFVDFQNQIIKNKEKIQRMEEKTLAALENNKIENNSIDNVFS